MEWVFVPGMVDHVSKAQIRATYVIKIPEEQPKQLPKLWTHKHIEALCK